MPASLTERMVRNVAKKLHVAFRSTSFIINVQLVVARFVLLGDRNAKL